MTISRELMSEWVVDALEQLGGSAELLDVAKRVWANHSDAIQAAGDYFYVWQYELRWGADLLRRNGILLAADQTARGVWTLASPVNAGK